MQKLINQHNPDDLLHKYILLDKSIGNTYDWIGIGNTTRFYKHPPKLTEDIVCYADGLREIIPEKLEISLDAQKALERRREKQIMMIIDSVPEKNQWFYFALEKHSFAEYFVIDEWITYWLSIWSKINKDYKPPTKLYNQFSSIEIQRANMNPIEKFYRGNLRNSGKRLVGLCPFHKERTPSFYIFENNTWHCFGACSTGGDAINFAMKLYGISFPMAIRRLLYGHN